MEKERRGFRHTIIYRNLDKDEFLHTALEEIDRLIGENSKEKKLVLVNILETEYNPNDNSIEEYSLRTNDGTLMTDSYVLYEVYIPNLLSEIRGEDFEKSLIVDSFEVVEESETFSSTCTLTNEYINSSEKEKESETPISTSNPEISE